MNCADAHLKAIHIKLRRAGDSSCRNLKMPNVKITHQKEGQEMKFNTYLFDFDGTLVDSMPVFADVMKRILDENNISYGDDLVKIITPLGLMGTGKYFREELGLDMSFEQFGKTIGDWMLEEYLYNIPLKKNVIKVLNSLKEQGASLNILTASPHITLDPCLKRLGIYDLFDNVWSCEDFKTTKADPSIYVKAAEIIGEDICKILFLDDNYNADKTAKLAGMKVCGVYDDSSKEYETEIRQVCDYYINDFMELLG